MRVSTVKRKSAALIAVLSLGSVVAVTWAIMRALLMPNLHLLNGTPVDLSIVIDGSRNDVPASSKSDVSVQPGLHHVVVRAGKLIDEDWIDVPASTGVVVYNALGAALFCLEEVRYASDKSHGEGGPPPRCFPGTTFWLHAQSVDYAFTEPPKSLEVDESSSNWVSKSLVAVEGDWQKSLAMLASGRTGTLDDAQRLIARLRRLPKIGGTVARVQAAFLDMTSGPSAGLSITRADFELHPEDTGAAWNYSLFIRSTGLTGQLNPELGAYARQHASSDDAQMAFARDELPAQAKAIQQPVVDRNPKNADYAVSLAVSQLRLGDAPGAVKTLDRAWAVAPSWDAVNWYAIALIETGQYEKAERLFSDALNHVSTTDVYIHYAALTLDRFRDRTSQMQAAGRSIESEGNLGALAEAILPGAGWQSSDTEPEGEKEAVEIHRAARISASAAWQACHDHPKGYVWLYRPVRLLLALEFARAGDPGLAQQIEAHFASRNVALSEMHDYVRTGHPFREMAFMEPEYLAALHFARARALEQAGEDARPEYLKAAQADVFKGPITLIMKQWPHLAGPLRASFAPPAH